ncbi:MAG: HAMP domain-containing protein [Desulfobacteraceae bacterium]|nr:MAG: HAMP domain-containing protein [Desulfobacteraceae bacterium]
MRKPALLNNLQGKLMILFSLFALVPLSALGAFSVQTAKELILNIVTNEVDHVARDKVELLKRWISERKADIAVVAGSSILSSTDPYVIAAYLELVRTNYRVYSGFAVFSRTGQLVYSTSADSPVPDGAEWFREALKGRLFMSDIFFDPERMDSFFLISAPLPEKTGDIARVICATVGTNTILSAILSVSLGRTGECYLVNREGMFLAHKEPHRILTENIAQSESFKNIFNARSNRITYIDYRGIEVIGSSSRVEGTDWALVVEQDRDEAFHAAGTLTRYISLVIAFSVLAALASAWLLSRYVAMPIHKLSTAADELAAGRYDPNLINTKRRDEIGLLLKAFADMAEKLRHREKDLETKVHLREAELKETGVELQKTQQAAVRSQQLASMGQLAAGVAHEIRTPLTSLKLFLESVESDIEVSTEFEEDFHVAMKQIKRMEDTINRFLDFARPQEPLFSDVCVEDLIKDALLVVGPRARQQETVIALDIKPSLPTVRGDRKQLCEVLVNLMVNALEAMVLRGDLKITACVQPFSNGEKQSEHVRIDIKDTGPGIAQEQIPKLFDPFFTTKATGTGLGLSIVLSIIQLHGGEVLVSSGEYRGATFSVIIPSAGKNKGKNDGKDTDS